ncbi:MAG: hypothetical protein KBS85_00770 [Lachnospiraceae bacterium]|nr:hypothetical protein [Candidatus Merdinaster equi]
MSMTAEEMQIIEDLVPGAIVKYRKEDGKILYSKRLENLFEDPQDIDDEVKPLDNFYSLIPDRERERVLDMMNSQLEFLHCITLNMRLAEPEGRCCLCEYRGNIVKSENDEELMYALLIFKE